jgi:hypothetical protein
MNDFEPILPRNQLKTVEVESGEVEPLILDLVIENPYKPINTLNLVKLLLLIYARRGWKPTMPNLANRRLAGMLIRIIGPEQAEWATIQAGLVAKHPYTFSFVQKWYEENKDKFYVENHTNAH